MLLAGAEGAGRRRDVRATERELVRPLDATGGDHDPGVMYGVVAKLAHADLAGECGRGGGSRVARAVMRVWPSIPTENGRPDDHELTFRAKGTYSPARFDSASFPGSTGVVKPSIFGKYILLERVSVGGMAEVYRARPLNSPGFRRFLAVKRILPNLAEDEEFVSMFVDEAKIAIQLNHRSVCQIYELGQLNDSFYIVMEYIPGKNLLQIQKRYREQRKIMSVAQTCYVTQKMCEGLDYSHRKKNDQGEPLGIIHRDVSPQNILISYEGEVKVIDFGIARAASKNQQTQVGVLKGKFGYMSPEQALGEDIDHRSDIFAVGVLLWEMLTARRLFHADSDFATLERVRSGEILPPSAKNPRVPPEVDRIVMRALDRDRTTRYQWASEMADDLRAFLAQSQPAFTDRRLSDWMCANWPEDVEEERTKAKEFQQFVTAQDVLRYTEKLYEELGEELLDADELEDLEEATRVFSAEEMGLPQQVAGERVLAANANESLARAVLREDEQVLPEIPRDVLRELSADTGPALPRSTGSFVPAPTLAPRRAASGPVTALLVLLLCALVGGASWYGWQAYVASQAPVGATLVIATNPARGVEVKVRGEVVTGDPPYEVAGLPAGQTYVELRAEGYEPIVEAVTLVDGQRLELQRSLVPLAGDSTVALRVSPPNAQVYLDGQLIGGQGASRTFSASARERHTVEVYLPGHFVESYEFTMQNNERFERDVELRPVQGRLTITSQPRGAVTLNGEAVAATGDEVVVAGLPVHHLHRLEIRSSTPGFQPYAQDILLLPPYERVHSARLRRIGETAPPAEPPAYGSITTGESSGWLRVFCDGIDTGYVTPVTADRPLLVEPGSHDVSFVRGGRERRVSVRVDAGQQLEVAIPQP